MSVEDNPKNWFGTHTIKVLSTLSRFDETIPRPGPVPKSKNKSDVALEYANFPLIS